MDYERKITSKWIGTVIRKKLGLKPQKTRDGYVIPAIPDYLSTLGIHLIQGEVNRFSDRIRNALAMFGGTFTGPELNGRLLPGASADWQLVLGDGTALGDIRYTLQTDGGDLLYVRSRSVRHGPADVLARLGRGEEVDASLYTFRAATRIETAAPDLDWLNKGVFVSVGGRRSGGVTYETYLVA